MPKLIDYPRTSYTGAWELAEVVDDTGGKCAVDTAAHKLDRKVSGSFKAIIGSAVKFGLLTSKRDLLTTTTLFKRIKHAYDKQEELLFHREAFLTPPLFTQLCRKFRSRELPVQMLDVMLVREFNVEEINSQGVAKAFVEGSRMVGLLDEHNLIADIDALTTQRPPRRELATSLPLQNNLLNSTQPIGSNVDTPQYTSIETDTGVQPHKSEPDTERLPLARFATIGGPLPTMRPATPATGSDQDAIASLFGLPGHNPEPPTTPRVTTVLPSATSLLPTPDAGVTQPFLSKPIAGPGPVLLPSPITYQIQVSGPGVNTSLSITEEADIALAMALLEKIRRQLNN